MAKPCTSRKKDDRMAGNDIQTTGTDLVGEIRTLLGIMDSVLSEGEYIDTAYNLKVKVRELDAILTKGELMPEQWMTGRETLGEYARRITKADDWSNFWSHKFVRGPVL